LTAALAALAALVAGLDLRTDVVGLFTLDVSGLSRIARNGNGRCYRRAARMPG